MMPGLVAKPDYSSEMFWSLRKVNQDYHYGYNDNYVEVLISMGDRGEHYIM